MIHRGFDNIFVLSGGLVAFVREGFQTFVEGNIEALPPPAPASGGGTLRIGGGGSLRSTAVSDGIGSTSSGGSGVSRINGPRGVSECNDGRSGAGGRLEYRYRGGQRVVVRGGGGDDNTSTTSSTRNSALGGGGGGVPTMSSTRGQQHGIGPRAGGRGPRGYPDGHGGGGNAGGQQARLRRGGLAEAAAAASAARRRSMQGARGGGAGGGDMSKGSAITVADSVISRSTARRGRW